MKNWSVMVFSALTLFVLTSCSGPAHVSPTKENSLVYIAAALPDKMAGAGSVMFMRSGDALVRWQPNLTDPSVRSFISNMNANDGYIFQCEAAPWYSKDYDAWVYSVSVTPDWTLPRKVADKPSS